MHQSSFLVTTIRIKSVATARRVLLIMLTSMTSPKTSNFYAKAARTFARLFCARREFESDIFKGLDQSLNGSPVIHESYLFQCEFFVDLVDVKLQSPCTRSPRTPISNAEMSFVIRASYSALLLVLKNINLKATEMLVPSRPYYITLVPPPRWVNRPSRVRCHS